MAAELVRAAQSESEDKPERLRWCFMIFFLTQMHCGWKVITY